MLFEKTRLICSQPARSIHKANVEKGKTNSMLCMICRTWVHGRCTKWNKKVPVLAKDFVCKKCEMKKKLNNDIDTIETVVIIQL